VRLVPVKENIPDRIRDGASGQARREGTASSSMLATPSACCPRLCSTWLARTYGDERRYAAWLCGGRRRHARLLGECWRFARCRRNIQARAPAHPHQQTMCGCYSWSIRLAKFTSPLGSPDRSIDSIFLYDESEPGDREITKSYRCLPFCQRAHWDSEGSGNRPAWDVVSCSPATDSVVGSWAAAWRRVVFLMQSIETREFDCGLLLECWKLDALHWLVDGTVAQYPGRLLSFNLCVFQF
jgi:hypothetical protein